MFYHPPALLWVVAFAATAALQLAFAFEGYGFGIDSDVPAEAAYPLPPSPPARRLALPLSTLAQGFTVGDANTH